MAKYINDNNKKKLSVDYKGLNQISYDSLMVGKLRPSTVPVHAMHLYVDTRETTHSDDQIPLLNVYKNRETYSAPFMRCGQLSFFMTATRSKFCTEALNNADNT